VEGYLRRKYEGTVKDVETVYREDLDLVRATECVVCWCWRFNRERCSGVPDQLCWWWTRNGARWTTVVCGAPPAVHSPFQQQRALEAPSLVRRHIAPCASSFRPLLQIPRASAAPTPL